MFYHEFVNGARVFYFFYWILSYSSFSTLPFELVLLKVAVLLTVSLDLVDFDIAGLNNCRPVAPITKQLNTTNMHVS